MISNTKVLRHDTYTETSIGLELRAGHNETGLKQELNKPSKFTWLNAI